MAEKLFAKGFLEGNWPTIEHVQEPVTPEFKIQEWLEEVEALPKIEGALPYEEAARVARGE